jgi:hypothetical protein
LGTGAVLAIGVAAGAEVTKDIIVGGLTVAGGSTAIKAAGAAGGAVAGKIIIDGVADHVMPPSPLEQAGPSEAEKSDTPPTEAAADNQADGECAEDASQPARGRIKGDLEKIRKEAALRAKHSHGAQAELDTAERYAENGIDIERRPDSTVPGRTNPDYFANGKFIEVKSRNTPVTHAWLKNAINTTNKQFANSGFEGSPQGSAELNLSNQSMTDAELINKVAPSVDRIFHPGQYTKITEVHIIHEGRLIAEWTRIGNKIVKTFLVK